MSRVFVSTEWLADRLGAPGLVVADVRGEVRPPGESPRYRAKRAAYDQGHIVGAAFVDWTRDIVDPGDPVPVQIARPDAFKRFMESIGVGDDTTVVAYDDYAHAFACRLAWALRYYGHDRVHVLAGGLGLWLAEGRAVTAAAPEPAGPVVFTPRVRPELRALADEVLPAVRGGALLIDARAPEQFAGAASAAARAGHIPGAKSVHYAKLLAEGGTLRPPDELRAVFAAAGVDLDHLPDRVVCYCNGGVTATVPAAALRELTGREVAIYDGSWNEWGNDPARPIE